MKEKKIIKIKNIKKEIFTAPKGMRDVLGEQYYYYQGFFEKAQEVAVYYGFQPIELPSLEQEGVYTSSVGIGTDIVDKEMYTLRTKGNKDKLALRPEGTAGVVRAYIQNGMQSWSQPVMLYYYGSFFRHDKPQKGRLREFKSFGLEVLGTEKSIADAIIIHITKTILEEAGGQNLYIKINSIGDKNCRAGYIKELTSYYKKHIKDLCTACKTRLKTNPLRLLDCKEPQCQPIKEEAPNSVGFLCGECKKHFKEVLEYLEELQIPYQINKNLVRGLNYYTKTVFEITEEAENSESQDDTKEAPLTIAAGGRYDYLGKALRGKQDIPAVGVQIGVDRVLITNWYKKLKPRIIKKPKIYFIQLGADAKLKSLRIIEILRQAKISISQSISKDSLGGQLRSAEKLEVPYAIIFGQKEALEDSVIVRNMENRSQETIKIENLTKHLKELK